MTILPKSKSDFMDQFCECSLIKMTLEGWMPSMYPNKIMF